MRNLNKKQKMLLDEWFKTIKNEPGLAVRDVVKDLMPTPLFEELEALNDHETIYQNINNYINNKVWN
jgi:hypothetical protein